MSSSGLWHLHIFCLNPSIALDLEYEWHYNAQVNHKFWFFSTLKDNSDFKIALFSLAEIWITWALKYHSYPKSRAIDGFEQKIYKCPNPGHLSVIFLLLCAFVGSRDPYDRYDSYERRPMSSGGMGGRAGSPDRRPIPTVSLTYERRPDSYEAWVATFLWIDRYLFMIDIFLWSFYGRYLFMIDIFLWSFCDRYLFMIDIFLWSFYDRYLFIIHLWSISLYDLFMIDIFYDLFMIFLWSISFYGSIFVATFFYGSFLDRSMRGGFFALCGNIYTPPGHVYP